MKLFHMGGRDIPRRPRESDEYVLSDVFDAILSDVARECGWDIEEDAGDVKQARADFISCARRNTDGYKIMIEIDEQHSWEGNAMLVDIFENAPFSECLRAHVQKWIEHFKVEPLFNAGDSVTFKHGYEEVTGVIESTENIYGPGHYTIRVDGMAGKPLPRWEGCEKA